MSDPQILQFPKRIEALPKTRIGYPTMNSVLEAAAEAFEVDASVLAGPSLKHPLSRYRWAIWAAMLEACQVSMSSVASFFGRDHTSVMNGMNRVHNDRELERWAHQIAEEARRRWVT